MPRLIAVLFSLVVLLAAAPTASSPPAVSADELLQIDGLVTYEVVPAEGPVRVTWEIDLENNDPETAPGASGSVLYYESLTVPVLRGATNLIGTGPAGGDLDVDIEESSEGPIDIATVVFDQPLFFEETYNFELTYDIRETRSTALLVTDSYVFLPAIASGDSVDVRVVTDDDPGWNVTLEAIDCLPEPAGTFVCEPSEFVQVAAFIEVARADVLTSSTFTVPLRSSAMSISLHHFPGEEAWASHISDLTRAALPVLENLFGYSYQGLTELEIAERGRQEISGYEGTFGCIFDSCVIGMSPLAGDTVAIHELAHLWTQPFESRWIAEGLAEFMSERATRELGDLVEPFDSFVPARTVDLQLDDWGSSQYLIGATADDLATEETGYYRSRQFFETLAATVGLEAIQEANSASADVGGGVDSETYFDLLEEASGARLDDLFLDEVFPPSYAPRLEQRRDLRERLDTLRSQARNAGFGLPARIGQLLDEWEFDEVGRLLAAAEGALSAYQDAEAKVQGSRDLLTRIGLLGKDPDETLGQAADAFAATEFTRSEQLSHNALDQIDGARDDGITRVLFGAGLVFVALLVLVSLVWLARSRVSHQT